MFDRVRQVVEGWTTMGCHVYDLSYCRVLRITMCDMQLEDAKSQCIMCSFLLKVVWRFGVNEPINFKGFMADDTSKFHYIAKDVWIQKPFNMFTSSNEVHRKTHKKV